jgi:hypothetical protein
MLPKMIPAPIFSPSTEKKCEQRPVPGTQSALEFRRPSIGMPSSICIASVGIGHNEGDEP